jgi:hypothetical protein
MKVCMLQTVISDTRTPLLQATKGQTYDAEIIDPFGRIAVRMSAYDESMGVQFDGWINVQPGEFEIIELTDAEREILKR